MAGAAGAAATPENRKLPKKEHDLFRSIVKFYEIKQYKKGLKAADAVLKKFPNHGETQAMKGLTLNCIDRKPEAYELVKQGLRNDVRSHVCWHVFGLLHRSDRNYGEAIKCYLNALRIDPNNLQILRDLASLQVQMRDLPGFVETRRQIVCHKPGHKINWMAFAVANHLAGAHANALSIIDTFLGTLDARERGYEESELSLYKALILEQGGQLEDALKLLEDEKHLVVDGPSWRSKRAELLLRLGRHGEAEDAYRALVGENCENYRYHAGLQCAVLQLPPDVSERMLALKGSDLPSTALSLAPAQHAALLALYDGLAADAPKSLALERIPLGFLEGDAFKRRVDAYMRKHLRRGLPSLGADLSGLYLTPCIETGLPHRAKDPYDVRHNAKYQTVVALVEGYIDALKSMGQLPPPVAVAGGAGAAAAAAVNGTMGGGEKEKEKETTLLWAAYLRSQLQEAAGDLEAAMATLEEGCLAVVTQGEENEGDEGEGGSSGSGGGDVTDAIDFLARKARLLKKAGDAAGASEAMDAARRMDLADRYINNKTTKYMLRAGRVADAQGVIALFAKHEGDPQHNLFEMQCMWYELEWARAAQAQAEARQGEGLGKALKKYAAVEKHFADFAEDQFDFHNYCLRRMTLRAYVEILRLEDELLAHKFYQTAARGAVACYLQLADRPKEAEEGEGPDYAAMTAEERKKAKAKARKAAKKLEAEAEEKKKKEAAAAAAAEEARKAKEGGGGGGAKKGDSAKAVDDDPDGEKLAAKDPLAEAARVVATLTRHARKEVASHVLAYDVAMKRGKTLLALQALIRGTNLRPDHPDVVLRVVDFSLAMQAKAKAGAAAVGAGGGGALDPTVAQVISAEEPGLLGGAASVEAYVDGYVGKAQGWRSLRHTLTAARCLARIQPGGGSGGGGGKGVAMVLQAIAGGEDGRGLTVEGLKEALQVLEKDLAAPAAALAEAKAACAKRFPRAAAFK